MTTRHVAATTSDSGAPLLLIPENAGGILEQIPETSAAAYWKLYGGSGGTIQLTFYSAPYNMRGQATVAHGLTVQPTSIVVTPHAQWVSIALTGWNATHMTLVATSWGGVSSCNFTWIAVAPPT